MDWNKIMILLFAIASYQSKSEKTSSPSDPLTFPRGLFQRIFIFGDAKYADQDVIRLSMEEANRIMSSTLNIHLQVIGIELLEVVNITYKYLQTIYSSSHYDAAIVLQKLPETIGLFQLGNQVCYLNSYSQLNIVHYDVNGNIRIMDGSEIGIRIAVALMRNLHQDQDPCPHLCQNGAKCLNEDVTFETSSREASSCFKKSLKNQISNVTSKVNNDNNFECLWKRKPDDSKGIIEIPNNGLREVDEECDCTFYDRECKKVCINQKWTDEEGERQYPEKMNQASLAIVLIVLIAVVVCVVLLFLFWRHLKLPRDQTGRSFDVSDKLSTTTIRSVDSGFFQSS
jgi:hypothetical protein